MRALGFSALLKNACFLVFLLATSAPATAGEYVLCLQKQLTVLGHDPGPHDGLWGRRTKAAALSLMQQRPELQSEPMLQEPRRVSAISWCRILGKRHGAARPFRPSAEKPNILFDKDASPTEKALVLGADKDARRYLYLRFGVSIAGRVDIAAGRDAKQVAANIVTLRRSRGDPIVDTRARVRKRCSDKDRWAAAAFYNQIFICWPQQDTYGADWAKQNRKRMTAILVHEHIHTMQTEYTLAKTRLYKRPDGRRVSGPEWMMEGTAMVVELDYVFRNFEGQGMPSFFRLQSPARASALKLADLGDITTEEEYNISLFAAYLLAERFGIQSLLEYWQTIGTGLDWDEAFQQVFDMKLAEYETQFETLRTHQSTAMNFIKTNT